MPLVATLVLLPCLVALGLWQLDRSRQKLEIRNAMLEAAARTPLTLADEVLTVETVRFRTVQIKGTYDTADQFLLDNKIHRGQAGYHVITPFQPSDASTRVLVNRGWLPWGVDRNVLPAAPAPGGEVEVTGRAVIPAAGYFELETQTPDTTTKVWQNLDLEKFGTLVEYRLQPFVVELDSESQAGGFQREWPEQSDDWVERHKGYAFQWFGLAITLVVINFVLWRRRRTVAISEHKHD